MERDERIDQILWESEELAATGRLAAGSAYEINNPLASIKNAFLLIKDAIPKVVGLARAWASDCRSRRV